MIVDEMVDFYNEVAQVEYDESADEAHRYKVELYWGPTIYASTYEKITDRLWKLGFIW